MTSSPPLGLFYFACSSTLANHVADYLVVISGFAGKQYFPDIRHQGEVSGSVGLDGGGEGAGSRRLGTLLIYGDFRGSRICDG
jgi:hypothetical protein